MLVNDVLRIIFAELPKGRAQYVAASVCQSWERLLSKVTEGTKKLPVTQKEFFLILPQFLLVTILIEEFRLPTLQNIRIFYSPTLQKY